MKKFSYPLAVVKSKSAAVVQKGKKFGAVAVMFALPAVSFAQDTSAEGDVSASVAKIALWLVGSVAVSAGMTAAVISIKASKLPRRGA